MKKLSGLVYLTILTTAFFIFGCGGNSTTETGKTEGSEATGEIKIDGSSTVYPLMEAMAEEFRAGSPKVNITIGESGTGGGFKKFGRGEIEISNASRPIKPGEDSLCKASNIEYIEIPIAYDGLAIVVNPKNTWLTNITVSELKKMWEPAAQGTIKKWNQINPAWPNEEIHLFGAGTQSGTFDYFTEAIVGKAKECRGDYTASEDDNTLVQGIAGDRLALGFFGMSYYENNKDKIKLVGVDNGKGGVQPTLETVRNGTYQPLSRPLFIYINKSAAAKTEIKNFVTFALDNANVLATEVGYVPLPDAVMEKVKARFQAGTTGSLFTGKSDVNVKMEDLLK